MVITTNYKKINHKEVQEGASLFLRELNIDCEKGHDFSRELNIKSGKVFNQFQ